jgi:hypothetical protein
MPAENMVILDALDYAVTQTAKNAPWLRIDQWGEVRAYLAGQKFDLGQLNNSRDHIMGLLSKSRTNSFPPSPPLNGSVSQTLDPAIPPEDSSSIDGVSCIPVYLLT